MTRSRFLTWLLALLFASGAENAMGAIAEVVQEAGVSTDLIIEAVGYEPGSTGGAETSGCPSNADSVKATVDKGSRESVFSTAATCVRERQPERAVALLTQLIRKDPADAVAYVNRGTAQAALGELPLALTDFTTAISLQPEHIDAWFNRGITFLHMRRLGNAVADLTEVIQLQPSFAPAYCNRGLANVQLGNYDEALADYSAGIDKDPLMTFCQFNRGSLYLVMGEYQKAISDLSEALGGGPWKAVALSRRGEAYEALGQHTQALKDFRSALDLDSNLESAKEGVARNTKQ